MKSTKKPRERETPYDHSHKVGQLLTIAASFGVYPGRGGSLKEVRRFFGNAENRLTPFCPRCGPHEHRVRFIEAEGVHRCRACGHKFMPEVLTPPKE